MRDGYPTWAQALKVALNECSRTGVRQKVTSRKELRGYAICPSRWFYVRPVSA